MSAEDSDFFDSVSPDDEPPTPEPPGPLPPLRLHCMPPPWLLDDLGRGMTNAHKRLLVGGWAVTPETERVSRETLRALHRRYEIEGGLLDRPGKLTTASIVLEVAGFVS